MHVDAASFATTFHILSQNQHLYRETVGVLSICELEAGMYCFSQRSICVSICHNSLTNYNFIKHN